MRTQFIDGAARNFKTRLSGKLEGKCIESDFSKLQYLLLYVQVIFNTILYLYIHPDSSLP